MPDLVLPQHKFFKGHGAHTLPHTLLPAIVVVLLLLLLQLLLLLVGVIALVDLSLRTIPRYEKGFSNTCQLL
jgi:hypothetical protein